MKLYILSFLISLSVVNSTIVHRNDLQQINKALKTGNHRLLSNYFNSSIELMILGKESTYTKEQAIVIMGKFFGKNKPSNFIVLHKGGPENAAYVIGNLTSETGMFRVYFLMKKDKEKNKIHQLRIEKEK